MKRKNLYYLSWKISLQKYNSKVNYSYHERPKWTHSRFLGNISWAFEILSSMFYFFHGHHFWWLKFSLGTCALPTIKSAIKCEHLFATFKVVLKYVIPVTCFIQYSFNIHLDLILRKADTDVLCIFNFLFLSSNGLKLPHKSFTFFHNRWKHCWDKYMRF